MMRDLDKLLFAPALLIPGKKPVNDVKLDLSNPLADGQIARYLINESSGPINDLLSNTDQGVLTGATHKITNKGQVLSFSPSSTDRVVVDDHTIFDTITDSITVEGWGYLTSYGTNSAKMLVKGDATTSGGYDWAMQVYSTAVQFGILDTGVAYNAAWSTALSLNVWHHFIGTYDGINVRLYVDGFLRATTAHTGSINNGASRNLVIGNANSAGNTARVWTGDISNVAVWNRALSADDVLIKYRNTYEDIVPANDAIWVPVSAGGVHNLAGDDLTVTPQVDTGALTKGHALAGDDLTVTPDVDTGALTKGHALAGDDLTVTPDVDTGALTKGHALAGDDLTVTPDVDTGAITKGTGIGVVEDTALASVTVLRSLSRATIKRTFESATIERTLESATTVRTLKSVTVERTLRAA